MAMVRLGFALLFLFVLGCKSKKEGDGGDETGFSYEKFSGEFKTVALPFQLQDTALNSRRDTAFIRSPQFPSLVSDSLRTRWFGKGTKVRYQPMARINGEK